MICNKCGVTNNPESKFCVGCGSPLEIQNLNTTTKVQPEGITPNMNMQNTGVASFTTVPEQTGVNPSMNNMNNGTTEQQVNSGGFNDANENTMRGSSGNVTLQTYFSILISILLKPYTALKQEGEKLNTFKSSFVLSLFISVFGVLINLIQTIWAVVRVKSYDYTARKYVTKFVFENIKDIKFVKVIGQNFLIYLGIIFAIACVFYIASLIIKKQLNFSKVLGMAAISVVPLFLSTLLFSPLLGMISSYLSTGISLIGGIYTILLTYEGMNEELQLKENQKYYFNLICFSILGIAAYYLYMKFFMDIGGNLGDLLDLFK